MERAPVATTFDGLTDTGPGPFCPGMSNTECNPQWLILPLAASVAATLGHGFWIAGQAGKIQRRLTGVSKQIGDLSWKVSMIGQRDDDEEEDCDNGSCDDGPCCATPAPTATIDVPSSLAAAGDTAAEAKKDD